MSDETLLGHLIVGESLRAGDVADLVFNMHTGQMILRKHVPGGAVRAVPGSTVIDLGTWPCMVCGDERPDALISVAHRPIEESGRRPGEAALGQWNVRYCVDRPKCVAVATAPGPWRGRPQPTTPDEGDNVS